MSTQSEIRVRQPSEYAFLLSLIAGIVMVAGSAMYLSLFYSGRQYFYGMMGGFGMYGGGYPHMISGYGPGFPQFASNFAILSLVAGVLVLIFSILIKTVSNNRKTWGILVIVFSIVGLAGIGGFYIGPVLGIVGGTLALTN